MKAKFAVDFFGTLFDAETALERFARRYKDLLRPDGNPDLALLKQEHYEEILSYGKLIESAPRNTYIYYTDHPHCPLDLIERWLRRRNQPRAPVVRIERSNVFQYEKLFNEHKLTAFIDDNPPFILAQRLQIPVIMPARPWNAFRSIPPNFTRITTSLRDYEKTITQP